MRIFFLLLLLANLAFFYWHEPVTAWLSERAAPARPVAAVREDAPSLVLLSERDAQKEVGSESAMRRSVPPVSQNADAGEGVTAPPASSSLPQTPPPEPVPVPQPRAPEQAPAQSAPPREQAQISAPAPAPARELESPATATRSSEPPRPLVGVCLEVGTWQDADRAQQAAGAAKEAGVKAALETAEREIPGRYWIVTQQRFDLAGARDAMRRMSEDGIKDIAIVSFEDGWAISLGLFSRPATADRRRREMLDLGYPPEVRRQTEKRSVHLLRLNPAGAQPGAVDGLLKTLQQTEPQLEWRESACP